MARVLVHAHSTWSDDGHIALTAFVDVARASGCAVVLLAEQEEAGWDAARYNAYLLACDAISTGPSRGESPVGACWMGGVRLVPGLEFSQEDRRVPCYGLRSLPQRPSSIDRLTRDADEQGSLLMPEYTGKRRPPFVVITESDDVLTDVAAGRYEIEAERPLWVQTRAIDGRARRFGNRTLGHLTTFTPMVSVVLPIRNEQAYVERALRSVLAQDYPPDRLEVVVADGRSTDHTRSMVRAIESRVGKRVTLIDNAGQIVPTGLNAALAVAAGDVIVRVDGHCEIPPDFVRRAVAHFALDDVDCVGGVLETVGETAMARVIATAMSVPFGVGGSAFRAGAEVSTLTDTVAFPAFTRQAVERTGLFDTELVRNQDDEYSYRLRKMGGRILLATDIHARYYSRGTLRSLWRQCFQYGFWKVRVMQRHPRQMRARQFVPALFVASLFVCAGLIVLDPVSWPLAALIVGAYLLAAGAAAWHAARDHDWTFFARLPVAFAAMHLSYGAGFLVGLAAFWRRWREPAIRPSNRPNKHWRMA